MHYRPLYHVCGESRGFAKRRMRKTNAISDIVNVRAGFRPRRSAIAPMTSAPTGA
jgi:hypothetical protein